MKTRIALTATLLALALPGAADWQYAKFGMTVDEVVAASQGKAAAQEAPMHDSKRGDVLLNKVLAKSEYSFKNYAFDVYFGFDPAAHTLRTVELDLKKGEFGCRELLAEMRATYRAPDTSRPGPVVSTYVWRSESTSNLLTLLQISDDICSLTYKALPRPSAGGL